MNKAKVKIYHSIGDINYSNFIINRELVSSVEEADLVFFEGGADVSPDFYGEPASPHTSTSPNHDKIDIKTYEEAIALNKPMFGTCRGHQFLSAMAGAKLIQHMSHPGRHSVYIGNNHKGFMVNSLHHQMVYPFKMPETDYEILAYAKHLSPYHLGGNFEELSEKDGKEVEAIYLPKINALAVQYHPEFLWSSRQLYKEMFQWLFKQFKDKLNLDISSPL